MDKNVYICTWCGEEIKNPPKGDRGEKLHIDCMKEYDEFFDDLLEARK